MSTIKPQSLKGLSSKRITRLVEEIAPLVARGLTSRRIAEIVGISPRQAAEDALKVKEVWADEYAANEICAIRGEAVANANLMYSEAMEAWFISKAQGAPVAKFLDTALSALKEKVKLSGAEIDLKLIQQNVNVSMASPEQVMQTFEPMSSADFAAFANAHAEAQLKAAEASRAIMPTTPEPAAEAAQDVDSEADWTGQGDDAPKQAKNRRIQHPFR